MGKHEIRKTCLENERAVLTLTGLNGQAASSLGSDIDKLIGSGNIPGRAVRDIADRLEKLSNVRSKEKFKDLFEERARFLREIEKLAASTESGISQLKAEAAAIAENQKNFLKYVTQISKKVSAVPHKTRPGIEEDVIGLVTIDARNSYKLLESLSS